MNKLDLLPPDIALTIDRPPRADQQPARRFVVLVPADADTNAVMQRIWELAKPTGAHVQLFSLCRDSTQAPGMYRQLLPMSALIRDGRITAEAHVEVGTNWVEAVTRNYQAGDKIVCFAWQRAGLLHKPLSQILQSSLNIPIYILSDPHLPEKENVNWVTQFTAWTGSLGLIVGFFLLQARVAMMPNDWIQTTLLILTVIAEFWLIWFWNSLFG